MKATRDSLIQALLDIGAMLLGAAVVVAIMLSMASGGGRRFAARDFSTLSAFQSSRDGSSEVARPEAALISGTPTDPRPVPRR